MDGKSKKEEEKNKKGVVGREEVQNPSNYFLGAIPSGVSICPENQFFS